MSARPVRSSTIPDTSGGRSTLPRLSPPGLIARAPNRRIRGSVVVAAVEVDAGGALGAEHGHVPAVVLDGEAELEAVVPQVPARGLLEVPSHLVVAPGAHEQDVPADPVPPEPRFGEAVDPFPPGGQQGDAQLRIVPVA